MLSGFNQISQIFEDVRAAADRRKGSLCILSAGNGNFTRIDNDDPEIKIQ